MKTKRYLIKFSRFKSDRPDVEEIVWVILETKTPLGAGTIAEWESEAWNALWAQYPLWNCPFNQSNPCKTPFDYLRYQWSSPFIGKHIEVRRNHKRK